MPITKSIAAHIPIKSVEYVEYYYSSDTDELNNVIHIVVLKLNKHIYVGRYAGATEEDAFNKAQDVVKGCLIKSGCFKPDIRLPNVPFKKYNFPNPAPLVSTTPNPTPNWGNTQYQEDGICPSGCNTNSGQQITGISTPINLYLTFARLAGPSDQPWVKVTSTYNASDASVFPGTSSGFTQIAQNINFTVENNQWVWFSTLSSDPSPRTLTVKNASDSDAILDTFTQVYYSACLLTTVVVNYLGLQDDGPELTAMRALRTHFKPVAAAELADYYQNSPSIINAISTAGTQTTEYNYIYNTVLAIVTHVNNEEWQLAYNLYMAMYTDLKARYLGVQ